jgi:hypothetical protein
LGTTTRGRWFKKSNNTLVVFLIDIFCEIRYIIDGKLQIKADIATFLSFGFDISIGKR